MVHWALLFKIHCWEKDKLETGGKYLKITHVIKGSLPDAGKALRTQFRSSVLRIRPGWWEPRRMAHREPGSAHKMLGLVRLSGTLRPCLHIFTRFPGLAVTFGASHPRIWTLAVLVGMKWFLFVLPIVFACPCGSSPGLCPFVSRLVGQLPQLFVYPGCQPLIRCEICRCLLSFCVSSFYPVHKF